MLTFMDFAKWTRPNLGSNSVWTRYFVADNSGVHWCGQRGRHLLCQSVRRKWGKKEKKGSSLSKLVAKHYMPLSKCITWFHAEFELYLYIQCGIFSLSLFVDSKERAEQSRRCNSSSSGSGGRSSRKKKGGGTRATTRGRGGGNL